MMEFLLLAALVAQDAAGVYVDETTGAVSLAGDLSRLALHSDPSTRSVITDMTAFQGRLVAAAGYVRFPALIHSQILEYLPEEEAWKIIADGDVRDTGVVLRLRVAGDLLLLPDSWGGSRLIRTFDGRSWDQLTALPDCKPPVDVTDVIKFEDRLYASSGRQMREVMGKSAGVSYPAGPGRVHVSADGGRTWTEIHKSREYERDVGVGELVEFRGKLYANEGGRRLIRWDGKEWEVVRVRMAHGERPDAALGHAQLLVFNDRIVASSLRGLFLFDGERWSSDATGSVDLWPEGKTLYGLRPDGHVYATADTLAWTQVTREGVPEKELVGPDLEVARSLLKLGCLAFHRGRLVVGTSAGGRIYASPYVKQGTFVSKPFEREDAGAVCLERDAVVPPGTKLRLRVRSSDAREGLEKAAWSDAPQDPRARLAVPGTHRWLQYRAELESDGRRTPVLRSARFAAVKP